MNDYLKILSVLFILCFNSVQAQITFVQDTTTSSVLGKKFTFEKLKKSSTKNLRHGKGITLFLSSGDTIHQIYGDLFEADRNCITIVPRWEFTKISTENRESTIRFQNCLATVPVSNINSLQYDVNYHLVPVTLGFTSLLAGLIVAPLVSIDKNAPNNFNTKRYTSILVPCLIGAGVGISFGIIAGSGKNRFKLKPTVVNSFQHYSRRSKRYMTRAGITW